MTGLGLWIADDGTMSRDDAAAMLAARLIPLAGFTDEPCAAEAALPGRGRPQEEELLRKCISLIMQPGRPLPMAWLAALLSGRDAQAGNVLRRYVSLQLSLAPGLRTGAAVTPLEGCFLLGRSLLVAPLGPGGVVDAQLPPGVWTELATGETMQGRLRRIRSLKEMPVLARENALVPVGVCDTRPDACDADRLTLHWYQPAGEAACTLADGTRYAVRMADPVACASDSALPWHLILHRDGTDVFVK